VSCWVVTTSIAQEPKRAASSAPVEETRTSDVHDAAGFFGAAAVASARNELRELESKTKVPTIIATVETLSGRPIEDEAHRMAVESGIEGIFTLISKKERGIQVLVSRRYLGPTMKQQRGAIRAAFTEGFRQAKFDEGLMRGVSVIGESLRLAQRAGELSGHEPISPLPGPGEKPAASKQAVGSLVLRNQVRLTLPGARVVIAAAQAKAEAMKLKVNVAVVDDGGHLLAFERMDGARPASGYTSITKAISAATFRQASGPLTAGGANPDPLLNLSLQNAAHASGGKITTLLGGVPVVVDGQVIGAVGVGGGTGEEDAQIANAGTAALLDQLASGPPADKWMDEKPK
jgi:glc operon protein GlcG